MFFETILILPISFWIAFGLIVAGCIIASHNLNVGWGAPSLAVLGTVAAWYVGDVFYNDYPQNHAIQFSERVLSNAWWEVALFVASFLIFVPILNGIINRQFRQSGAIFRLVQSGATNFIIQSEVRQIFIGTFYVWCLLLVVATVRVGLDIPYYFFPFLGEKANPWIRERIGGSSDAIFSLAGYIQMFVAAVFGIVLALANNGKIRMYGLLATALTWPYYIFDRTRNSILAVLLPAILAWVFIRLQGTILKKVLFLLAFFLIINVWFGFVITYRSGSTIAEAFHARGVSANLVKSAHHEGLNMFEELCWINQFIDEGTYHPSWGRRYFAEIVNPIPRGIWPNKPMLGIDYAIARGQGAEGGEAGVVATVTTGMIGQGVVNFDKFFGPISAAFLMALWVSVLARIDFCGELVGNISLYIIGLVLTFNLGRDISFITLYMFCFGALIVWLIRIFLGSAVRSKHIVSGKVRSRKSW